MGIWDFSGTSTIDLLRIVELDSELNTLGIDADREQIGEIYSELEKRGNDEDENLITIVIFHDDPEVAGIWKVEQKYEESLTDNPTPSNIDNIITLLKKKGMRIESFEYWFDKTEE